MSLPHNEVFNSITAGDAVNSLQSDPKSDVVFATSQGFWGDDSDFDSVYSAYEKFFEQKQTEITTVLGKPSYQGHWIQDTYPIFAIGERVAVWGAENEAIYLRIYHQDQEVGIEVSLLTPQSPNSNHETRSIYDGIRQQIKAAQGK
jgi:hypothetical protein